jgi:hypothetical protein
VFPPVGLVLVLMISAIIGPPIRLILMDSCLPVGRFRGNADLRGCVASTASVAPGAGLFLWGGDRRVKASGDELVSLGVRVGNPSTIGWHQRKFFSIPVTRSRYTDNEQKNRDAQFASKNGQKPKPIGWPAYTSSAPNYPARRGIFLRLSLPSPRPPAFRQGDDGGQVARASFAQRAGEKRQSRRVMAETIIV